MAPTYSLAQQGYGAHNPVIASKPRLYLPDANVPTYGAMQQAMRLGTALLCQMPDGQQANYVFDEERCYQSANPVVRRI